METHEFRVFTVWQLGCIVMGGGTTMLSYAWTFLIVAIIAAILGFGGIAAGAAGIAKILFFVFIVLFAASLLFGRRTTI
jgi:uncharacterized membrane protein YtjA (UPF0391 family)